MLKYHLTLSLKDLGKSSYNQKGLVSFEDWSDLGIIRNLKEKLELIRPARDILVSILLYIDFLLLVWEEEEKSYGRIRF